MYGGRKWDIGGSLKGEKGNYQQIINNQTGILWNITGGEWLEDQTVRQ